MTPHESPSRRELRETVRLAVPIVAIQLGLMGMGAVDTIMVGHVSARVLSSVALGNLYFVNVSIWAAGTLLALDTMVAQAVGAGDDVSVAKTMQRGLILALGLGLITAAAMLPCAPILRSLHQQPETIPDAVSYIWISIPGVFPFLAFIVLRQSLQAIGRLAPVLWTTIGANFLNAGLNWVFVYGHFGVPALGATGSAIATCISRWAMALGLLLLAWPELRRRLRPMQPDLLSRPAFSAMLHLGLPVGVQQLLEIGAFSAIGFLMGILGTVQLAAHQIAITLAALTFMVPLGVGGAAATRVGRATGAGDADGAKLAANAAYVCGVGFMTMAAVLFLLLPHLLAGLFTNDHSVVALAATLIQIAGVFQVFDGGQAVGAGVLRGLGDTKAPVVAMLAGYWLFGLPVSAYLGLHTSMGAPGLWWGFVVSLGVVAIFLGQRVRVTLRGELRRTHF